MLNHNHVVFDDPFIVERSIEEFAPLIDILERVEPESPRTPVLKRLVVIGTQVGAQLLRSIYRIARAVQWASQPTKHQRPSVHPGLGLEFMVFGIFVVSVAMSLLM
jgi:hypothetical protein